MAFLVFSEVPPEGGRRAAFRSSDRRKISHPRFRDQCGASQKISAQSVKKWPRNPMLKSRNEQTDERTNKQPQICPNLLIVDCEKFRSRQKLGPTKLLMYRIYCYPTNASQGALSILQSPPSMYMLCLLWK